MHFPGELFLHYGYVIVFGWVMLEQLGVPLPSTPILLTAGTLTATHHMRIGWVVLAVMTASAISDSIWFRLGGRYGSAVTRWICRFSIEAASCVRRTEDVLAKNGPAGLLLAKFIPGLNTMAAPLAGQSKMPYRIFLAVRHGRNFHLGCVDCGRGPFLRRCDPAKQWTFALAGPLGFRAGGSGCYRNFGL